MSEAFLDTSVSEILNVRNNPGMAFQSYRVLNGERAYRDTQRDTFIAGDIANPTLDYPLLQETDLTTQAHRLNETFSVIDTVKDPTVRTATWDSASYRLADMYWSLSAENIARTYYRRSPEELDSLVARTQDLNEQLYGVPEISIAKAMSAEIWGQIDSKQLTPGMAKLKQELEYGTTVTIQGEEITVAPLMRHDGERLPQMPPELLTTLKEKLLRENADIAQAVYQYWEHMQSTRPESEWKFTPEDVLAVFQACHALRDPENTSGVSIMFDPSATATSWDTSQSAVKVGGGRAPVTSPDAMLGVVLHEYVVHGGRSIHGGTTNVPPLATGMFTEADPGETSDYVTFEEGLAGTCELAVHGKNEGWKPANLEKYLGIVLAYEGRDFRQVYETLWRTRALMNCKDGGEPSMQALLTAKRNAYASCVRIFRGTPTDMPRMAADGSPRVLTYNKDLAYLKGKLQVIEFWKRYGNDPAMIDLAFKGKFDPLNRRQLAIARAAFAGTNA